MIFPFLPFMCVWHLEIILWFSRSEISNFSISIFQCSHKLITIANYMLYYKHLIYIYFYYVYEASLVAQIVKNLLAIQKIQVPSLEQEDPLEKGMAIYYSVLAWRIKWTRVRKIPWRRKWQPTSVFLLGNFLGQWSPCGVLFYKLIFNMCSVTSIVSDFLRANGL